MIRGGVRRAFSFEEDAKIGALRREFRSISSSGVVLKQVTQASPDVWPWEAIIAARWELLRRVAFGEEPASCLHGLERS